jgi:hypothetical protein
LLLSRRLRIHGQMTSLLMMYRMYFECKTFSRKRTPIEINSTNIIDYHLVVNPSICIRSMLFTHDVISFHQAR